MYINKMISITVRHTYISVYTSDRHAQGGIDEGEVAQAAAFRELREETGVTSAELLGEVGGQRMALRVERVQALPRNRIFALYTDVNTRCHRAGFDEGVTLERGFRCLWQISEWMTYDFPPDVKLKITRLWGKEWTGQAQKW